MEYFHIYHHYVGYQSGDHYVGYINRYKQDYLSVHYHNLVHKFLYYYYVEYK